MKSRWDHARSAEAYLEVAEMYGDQALELEGQYLNRTSVEALRYRIREEHALIRAQVHATLATAEVLG